MKNRNVILAAVVLISAVGSSVASAFFAPTSTWIKAIKVVGSTTAATCSTIGALCDPATGSSRNCEVRVNLQNGLTVSTIGYSVQSANICSVPLRTGSAAYTETVPTIFTQVETYAAN